MALTPALSRRREREKEGALVRRINPYAKPLRREMTDAERAIWFAVRDRQLGGFKFRRQVTLGPYVVDFICAECCLILEIDGGQHDEAVDQKRTEKLLAMDYRLIRFWNNDVLGNLEGVVQTIHQTLLASPSPACGRGPG